MEFSETVRRRAMVRSFSAEPVGPGVVDRILRDALRSPTAGNSGGTAWVVLEGPDQTAVYWGATTDDGWQARNRTRHEGLRRAPVILLAYSCANIYVARYGEKDKSASGLGEGADRWPVPYWTGDAAFGVMVALLGAVDAGLGACVLGAFRGESELGHRIGTPEGWRLFCAVALGKPDRHDVPSASIDRPRPHPAERIHRGAWRSPGC
jgi:nitroreductase